MTKNDYDCIKYSDKRSEFKTENLINFIDFEAFFFFFFVLILVQ